MSNPASIEQGTRRRVHMVGYMAGYFAQNRTWPSVRQIGKAAGLRSPSTVHHHLETLEAEGLVVRFVSTTQQTVWMLVDE